MLLADSFSLHIDTTGVHSNILPIMINDMLDVILLAIIATVPGIYAGLFILKALKIRRESIKILAINIAIGILFAFLYDLLKSTSGISTGSLRTVTDVFNIIVFLVVFLSFTIVYRYINKKHQNNKYNNYYSILFYSAYLWAMLGVGLHTIGEGIVIGYDFRTGATSLSLAQVSSFILHKIGEGFTMSIFILCGKLKNIHILLIGAIATFPILVGASMGYSLFSPSIATYFFAGAAGATIFIITKFINMTKDTSLHNRTLIGILAGFLFMYFSGVIHQFE